MNANFLPLFTATLLLLACTNTVSEPVDKVEVVLSDSTDLPPIKRLLAGLPDEAALVAAHRGTGNCLGVAENSLSGLEALIERSILMAKIMAKIMTKIKEGTLISFHDDVWEMISSGMARPSLHRPVIS